MNILGLSAFYHDSSCCLLRNGKLVAAAAEERFSRVKHDAGLPVRAFRFCLEKGGLDMMDIDCLAYYELPDKKMERQIWQQASQLKLPGYAGQQQVEHAIRERLGYEGPILFFGHHRSHAASTFYFSGFEEAAILSVDGVGEWATTAYGFGSDATIHLFEQVLFPHSLGLFYATITAYLGFRVNDGEYKVILTVTDVNGNSGQCQPTVTGTGNPALANGIPETCDGVDNNCNGAIDEGFDLDGDGFSSCNGGSAFGDCDDANAAVFPGAAEVCNGIDDNCDGEVDETFDVDGDGFTPCAGDCADNDPNVHPGAPEICNGKDNDCNGLVDDGIGGVPYLGSVTFTTQAQINAWRPCYDVIQGNLYIFGFGITDLGPLANIIFVTGDVSIRFNSLTNLHGLEGLQAVGRDIEIQYCGKLTTLDGLQNLSSVGRRFSIFNNNLLTDCCAVQPLLATLPANRKSIFGNLTTCETEVAINADCMGGNLVVNPNSGFSTATPIAAVEMQLVPNPATDEVTVRLLGTEGKAATLTLFDHLGRTVLVKDLEGGQNDLTIGLKDGRFQNGLYMVSATTADGTRVVKRLLIAK